MSRFDRSTGVWVQDADREDGAKPPLAANGVPVVELMVTGAVSMALTLAQERIGTDIMEDVRCEGYPDPGATNVILLRIPGITGPYHRVRMVLTVEPDPDNEPF